MKITVSLVSSALALCLAQTIFADPKPVPTPQQVLITYQVLQVPGGTGIPVSTSSTASEFYKSALQNIKETEATEISVQTTADFPAEARYNRILTFSAQDHGKPTRVFLDVPTRLQAVPHINPDGTITVQLKTEITRPAPAVPNEVPLTNSAFWQTTQTFKSGEIQMFGTLFEVRSGTLFVGNSPKILAENKALIASDYKQFIQFVTVTVLPAEKTAKP